jgi:hypothetical protein
MLSIPQHSMRLARVHPSGAEEWHCPTCGRRILLEWPPRPASVVLASGDAAALHSGGHRGLSQAGMQAGPAEAQQPGDLSGSVSGDHLDRPEADQQGLGEAELPEFLRPWFRVIQDLERRGLQNW